MKGGEAKSGRAAGASAEGSGQPSMSDAYITLV
jgi:hypothetical protein